MGAATLLAAAPPARALAPALAAPAASGAGAPPVFQRYVLMAEDDPLAAQKAAAAALAAGPPPVDRFWLLLAQARALALLEDTDAASARAAEAGEVLKGLPDAAPAGARWLAMETLTAEVPRLAPAQAVARLAGLRATVDPAADPALACEVAALDMWILVDNRSLDEAWIAAEEVERCAVPSGQRYLLPLALSTLGHVVASVPSDERRGRDAADLMRQALDALGGQGSRFRRSIIEWELAWVLQGRQDWAGALQHLGRAMAISEALGDQAGVGAALIEIARVHMERNELALALRQLDLAGKRLPRDEETGRRTELASLKIQTLTRLQRRDVLDEIEQARRWDIDRLQPAARARLADAMAQGYASQGQWQQAYVESQRAKALFQEARSLASDTQVLRLQARYDSARREAENASLRHAEENSRLALQAEAARQRALWALLALLLIVLAGAGTWLRVLSMRRRTLAELAMRDELTGALNRRAIAAYAESSLAKSRRDGLPVTLALIDLDHFKRVNDVHGHAAGDALLRAFVQACTGELRGQDRLGRWGGEEWLLVMPGTRRQELPAVFARLREAFARLPVDGLPTPHGCTFSMGVAQGQRGAQTLHDLVAQADRTLYEAKQDGRDRVAGAA